MAIIAMNSAATGLKALSTQLDVISNNIANANNDGFKSSRANFEDVFYQYYQEPGVKNNDGDIRPIGLGVGYGTRISGTELDMTQGTVTQTGNPLDVAIQGDGFFQVKTLSTQGDGLAYTRTGKFFVNPDGNLVLNSNDGYLLQPPVNIPQGATGITIGNDGRVSYIEQGATTATQGPQIQLAHFVNSQGLVQLGGNLYQQSDASGPVQLGAPGANGTGYLKQGFTENSNVDPVTELVNLIKTQRTFELNSQSIQAADQMLQQVNNLRH
ncbi:MAG TPA: flagellar basal-body rod protein FlgG [Phycisphaerae bacterium]|jgi:flagellar basal-body rod protein FlgG|nr:flagellar basal-body rod protein FlgG [Phycisphaerae bacterium]